MIRVVITEEDENVIDHGWLVAKNGIALGHEGAVRFATCPGCGWDASFQPPEVVICTRCAAPLVLPKEDGEPFDFREMTPEQASFVRALRVDEDRTWREVASAFALRYAAVVDWEPSQLSGMALCALAAKSLGEHHMRAPWN